MMKRVQIFQNEPIIKPVNNNHNSGGIIMNFISRITRLKYVALVAFIFYFVLAGCEKSTTDPANEPLQLSQGGVEGLVSGWQTIHSVNSVGAVNQVLEGDVEVDMSQFGGIYSPTQIEGEYSKFKDGLQTAVASLGLDGIQLDDSLIWFIDWTDPISGVSVRKALYYYTNTGHARYYEAIYQFPGQLRLTYDSTEIRADLNFTLEDGSDDKFLSLYKFTNFEDGFFIDRIESEAQATAHDPNNQVIGATAFNHVWYGEQSRLSQLRQDLVINPDESGSISERLDYRDNTYLQRTITFYADYTGDYSETWRDGTQVTGTFDRLEDDNHASFTRLVDFPSGFFVNTIEQLADVTLNPVDSTVSLLLNEKILFAIGLLDTSELVINEYYENDIKNTHILGTKSDGSVADLLVKDYPGYQEIDGSYIGPEGYYSLIHAFLYSDGSGELWLTVYQSQQAYLNGEPPIATIHIHFNPDGSGEGEMAEGEISYTVRVGANGEMFVQDGEGRTTTVNGY
jgi:hypothetical protein